MSNHQTIMISSLLGALDRWLDVELNPPPSSGRGEDHGVGDDFESGLEELRKLESMRSSAKDVMHKAWLFGYDVQDAKEAHLQRVKRLEKAQREIGSSVADRVELTPKISELVEKIIGLEGFIYGDEGKRFSGEKEELKRFQEELAGLGESDGPNADAIGKLKASIRKLQEKLTVPSSRYAAESTELRGIKKQLERFQRKNKEAVDKIHELEAATEDARKYKETLDALETLGRSLLPRAEIAGKYIADTESVFKQLSERNTEWEGKVRATYERMEKKEIEDELKRLIVESKQVGETTTPRGRFISKKKGIINSVLWSKNHPLKEKDSK